MGSPGSRWNAGSAMRSASGCRSSTRSPVLSARTRSWSGSRRRRRSAAWRSSSGCVSDLHSLEQPVVLIIDDLHELRSAEALQLLELFLTELPPELRVVLATREDLRLGLHRLRLDGAADRDPRRRPAILAGGDARAAWTTSGVALSDAGLALLNERTEGWAAGLRLAAISLARHPDPERFVTEFCGSERTVAGYLLAEVLERQPPEVRDLLLRTSVLERVSGPLARRADRRHGFGGDPPEPGGRRRLRHLARRGADVVSLSPPVRRSAAARTAADLPGADRLAAPHGGTVVRGARATWSRRSATRRRRATGRTPPGCSPTTTSAWCWTAATRRCARCWPPSRPTRPRLMRSWLWRSPPAGCSTVCSTRARRTSPSPSGWPRQCPTTQARSSTYG